MTIDGSPSTPIPHWLHPLHPDEIRVVDALQKAIRVRSRRIIREWHTMYSAHFGPHRALPEPLLRDTYIPLMGGALTCMARGDVAGFTDMAGALGDEMARAAVPFVAVVAHLNLMKQSCLHALADEPRWEQRASILLEKLNASFISAAADHYYRQHLKSCEVPLTAPSVSERLVPVRRAAPEMFHGLVGASAPMRRVFEQITRVAPSNAPVLIIGETGTGKELVARAIHDAGPRSHGPFIAVNCAALPRELIESELFGYKRGAFSGALADHVGLLRAATGGTLLLDEVTEMSFDLQAKLLRVLQERTVRPVGSVTEVPADVRFIASTNRDPAALLASNALRADLYYRLSGRTIVVPPLREHPHDIIELARHQFARLQERYGQAVQGARGLTPEALRCLEHHPWPGNVRELFNVLEDAFTSSLAVPSQVCAADLTLTPVPMPAVPLSTPDSDAQTLAESERVVIARALAATGGNKLQAARQLGISRKKLYAKIAKYTLA